MKVCHHLKVDVAVRDWSCEIAIRTATVTPVDRLYRGMGNVCLVQGMVFLLCIACYGKLTILSAFQYLERPQCELRGQHWIHPSSPRSP